MEATRTRIAELLGRDQDEGTVRQVAFYTEQLRQEQERADRRADQERADHHRAEDELRVLEMSENKTSAMLSRIETLKQQLGIRSPGTAFLGFFDVHFIFRKRAFCKYCLCQG